MSKKKSEEKIDPTLPFTEIEILGKTYKMCFNFRAIAVAEARLRAARVDARLIWQIGNLTLETVPIFFAASLGTFHPDLSFEEIVDLLDWDTVIEIREKLTEAWMAAMPKRGKEEKNPQQPVLD